MSDASEPAGRSPQRHEVLLMRHAKSSWKDPKLADHDRPLKKRGRRDAVRMAEFLVEQNLVPDRIVSSSAARARETTDLVASHLGNLTVETLSRLYHAEADIWRSVLAELPGNGRTLLVGHNPGIEELLSVITEGDVTVPTAAVAHLRLRPDRLFLSLDGLELCDVYRPKEI